MHDVPYVRGVAGPEVTACMARIAGEVRAVIGDEMALGVQILSCKYSISGYQCGGGGRGGRMGIVCMSVCVCVCVCVCV